MKAAGFRRVRWLSGWEGKEGKERKGKERKGKERKGKERKGRQDVSTPMVGSLCRYALPAHFAWPLATGYQFRSRKSREYNHVLNRGQW